MAADKYVAVIVRRKGLADQVQLNFSTEDAANNAFAKIHSLTGPAVFSDSFGVKLWIMPEEVGPVTLIDVERNLEFKSLDALMVARANATVQKRAAADPALQQRVMMPGPTFPQ